MTRRLAIIATLAVAGSAAAFAAPMSFASTAESNPCPVSTLAHFSNGNLVVTVPDPAGQQCFITVTVPIGSIKPPAQSDSAAAFPPPDYCPVQPLAWTAPDGNIVVSIPDPTGKQCRDNIELPIGVPPT